MANICLYVIPGMFFVKLQPSVDGFHPLLLSSPWDGCHLIRPDFSVKHFHAAFHCNIIKYLMDWLLNSNQPPFSRPLVILPAESDWRQVQFPVKDSLPDVFGNPINGLRKESVIFAIYPLFDFLICQAGIKAQKTLYVFAVEFSFHPQIDTAFYEIYIFDVNVFAITAHQEQSFLVSRAFGFTTNPHARPIRRAAYLRSAHVGAVSTNFRLSPRPVSRAVSGAV